MAKLEAKANDILNKVPRLKKVIKRCYQLGMYSISPKIKFEGNIVRVSPEDNMEYFFGYYDKSPWDLSERYILCLRVENTYLSVAPKETAEIILIDTKNNNSYRVIGKTSTWNVQQGCMLQWLGPDYSNRIIYNDFRNGKYCAVILDVNTGEEQVISMPIYSVADNGKFALSLDFSRLHRLRKGYGYSNIEEKTKDEKCPDEPCIWYVDLQNGDIKPIIKYTDFKNFETRKDMIDGEHKVNHIMLNPSGDRFMVLHRWFHGTQKYTRLITANVDGSNMYNLSDDNMVSHCCWKNDNEILAYARKRDYGNGYYIMNDKTNKYNKILENLNTDGHPSYSYNKEMIVTDTYPDRSRISTIYIIKDGKSTKLAKVFSPFRYDNDVRCDLHPRWDRSGNYICFDSVFEGKRGLYLVKI